MINHFEPTCLPAIKFSHQAGYLRMDTEIQLFALHTVATD